MRRAIVAILALAGLFSVNATGAVGTPKRDVQWLYEACKDKLEATDSALCVGYISGVGDFMQANGTAAQPNTGVSLCAEPAPSYGAMIQAFTNWAEKHPEAWGQSRLVGLVFALRETFPCH